LAGVGVLYVKKSASVPSGYKFEQREVTEPVSTPSAERVERAAVAPASKPVRLAKATGVPEVELEEEKVFIYDSTDLRNPMAPLLAKVDKDAPPGVTTGVALTHVLDGIIWSPTNPLAIIDRNVVGVGDTLQDGSVMTEVGGDYVVVEYGGKKFRLTLE